MHINYTCMTYIGSPSLSKVNELYNFGGPSLVIITIYQSYSLMPRSAEILKKYINFTLKPPNYLPLEFRVMKFTFSCLLTNRCYIPNWVKIGSAVVSRRWATQDDGSQPIAICHLSISGNLKTSVHLNKSPVGHIADMINIFSNKQA